MIRNRIAPLWMTGLAVALTLVGPARAEVEPPPGVRPLLVGTRIPRVTLRTASGDPVALGPDGGGGPRILIFYRGGW